MRAWAAQLWHELNADYELGDLRQGVGKRPWTTLHGGLPRVLTAHLLVNAPAPRRSRRAAACARALRSACVRVRVELTLTRRFKVRLGSGSGSGQVSEGEG